VRSHSVLDSLCSLSSQGQSDLPEEVAFDIEKDVNRTFPEVAKCAPAAPFRVILAIARIVTQPACLYTALWQCEPVLLSNRAPASLPLPQHRFATGKGVQSLMNVLKAYAALDPEVSAILLPPAYLPPAALPPIRSSLVLLCEHLARRLRP